MRDETTLSDKHKDRGLRGERFTKGELERFGSDRTGPVTSGETLGRDCRRNRGRVHD